MELKEGIDYTVEEINLMRSEITGLQFYDYAIVARELDIGDELELRRETFNEHDHKAIAVYHNGFKIGFIARENNSVLHTMLDRGVQLSAFVIEHNKTHSVLKEDRRLMASIFMSYTFLIDD